MRRPAEVFPPGDFLREELEARGWRQTDLADILDRPVGTINEIISGKRGISPATARDLAAALGTSAEFWLNLDAAYQLSKVREGGSGAITRRATLYAKAPVKDMIRRGWIEPSENVAVLEERVLKFLGIKTLDEEPDLPLHAARKSTSYAQSPTPAQTAWLCRVSQLARAVHARPFRPGHLADTIDRLRLLLVSPQEIRHVPSILSDAGIRFVVVQPLPGGKIDGACLWLDGMPVIALSLRFDRLDNFWFGLWHELHHVEQGTGSIDLELEAKESDPERPTAEHDADRFAVEHMVPQSQLESFIARIRPLYSATRIEAFARTVNVHPALVVGQLQHRGEISHSSFRQMMVPVRTWITASALTDGWGSASPIQM